MVAGPPLSSASSHHHQHQHFYNRSNSNEQHGIRDVWADNLETEMRTICRLISRYPYVAMDTEFPGVVGRPSIGNQWGQNSSYENAHFSRADYAYQSMRVNVNMLKLIQLGLTLMDEEGRTPPGPISTWQFNFHFSLAKDMYQESSIRLLTKAGITFARHEAEGVDPRHFAALLTASGLVLREEVTWLSFHSGYDFGYLLRMLTGAPELPPTMTDFFDLLRIYFPRLYDLKYLVGVVNKRCTPHYNVDLNGKKSAVDHQPPTHHLAIVKGGLSEIAKQLNITRKGASHQAGSDSLLTGETFFKVRRLFFDSDLEAASKFEEERNDGCGVPFLGTIYGLKVPAAGNDGLGEGVRFTKTSATRYNIGGSDDNLSTTPSPPLEDDEEEDEEVAEDEVEALQKEVVDEKIEKEEEQKTKVVEEDGNILKVQEQVKCRSVEEK